MNDIWIFETNPNYQELTPTYCNNFAIFHYRFTAAYGSFCSLGSMESCVLPGEPHPRHEDRQGLVDCGERRQQRGPAFLHAEQGMSQCKCCVR